VKIDLHYGMDPSFGPHTHEEDGIGGTENFITHSAEYLALAGHEVRVYNKIVTPTRDVSTDVTWLPLAHFNPTEPRDVLVSFRTREVFENWRNAGLKVIALADTESHGLGDAVRVDHVNLVMFVSRWQAKKIMAEEGIPPQQAMVTGNGVSMRRFDEMRDSVQRVPGKCIHIATPERGLEPLLDIWPAIQERVPYANLHLFSSFLGWRMSNDDNIRMCGGLYERINQMIEEGCRIINHQHVNAPTIRRHLLESQLYLYPTRWFNETCCISALEAAAAGVPIVATARAALKERVRDCQTGYLIQERDGHDYEFAEMAIKLLTDGSTWRRMSEASVEMARRYDYARLVGDWTERWEHEIAVRG
jgi:glycosyltransferase involved in cell wall biosynthesis